MGKSRIIPGYIKWLEVAINSFGQIVFELILEGICAIKGIGLEIQSC